MKPINVIVILILVILIVGCEQNEELVWASYSDIQCETLWDDSIECDSTEECLRLYLAERGIEVYDIEIEETNTIVASACGNWSGILLHVLIEDRYTRRINRLGFYMKSS